MTAMMPDEPEIQANVAVLSEIEKETSNTSKIKEELKNDQKKQQDHLLANHQTKFPPKEREISTKTTRQTSFTAPMLCKITQRLIPTTFSKLFKFTNAVHTV